MTNTQTMIQGDCLPFMKAMPDASFDAVITDPPYASGGLTTADRKASPVRKYISRDRHPSFDSDTRDQRSHFMWSVLWMAEALRLTREGGWLMVCSDWRQLPTTQRRLAGGGLDMALRGHLGQDGGMPPPSRHVPQSSRVRPGGHPRQHRQRAGPSARVPGRRFPSLPQTL